jgi:hypothetical protein
MKTKIHEQTLRADIKAGSNLNKTVLYMESSGTSILRLYEHIKWCITQPKEAISGRNFSTVHDLWDNDSNLTGFLLHDTNLFKLRRKDLDIEAL